jgi:hypothetical protein
MSVLTPLEASVAHAETVHMVVDLLIAAAVMRALQYMLLTEPSFGALTRLFWGFNTLTKR